MQQVSTETTSAGSVARRRPASLRLLHALAVAGLVAALLVACASAICELKGEAIIRGVLEDLIEATGCGITVRSATVRILPRPVIFAEDITVSKDGVTVRASFASMRPSVRRLLSRSLLPSEVHLLRPRVEGALLVPFSDGLKQGTPSQAPVVADLSFLAGGCRLVIEDCSGQLRDSVGNQLDIWHLTTSLLLTPLTKRVKGTLSAEHVVYRAVPSDSREHARIMADIAATRRATELLPETPDRAAHPTLPHEEVKGTRPWFALSAPAIGLHRVALEGGCDLSRPETTASVKMHAETRVPFLEASLKTDLALLGSRAGLTVLGNIDGAYRFDGADIPFNVRGTCQPISEAGLLTYRDRLTTEGGMHISLQNLSMGDDNAGLDAVIAWDETGPVATGRLSLTHLSLTRWLTFARLLTPGLQEALDHVTEGIIDFRMDTKGLTCPFLSAEARGSVFTGTGGIADWKNPEVFLDMSSEFVNLGEAIPESVGQPVAPVPYLHRPLSELRMDELMVKNRQRRLEWFRRFNPSLYRRILEEEAAAGYPEGESALAPGPWGGTPPPSASPSHPAPPGTPPAPGMSGDPDGNTPAPGTSGAPGDRPDVPPPPGLDYDIRLRADTIRYGLFTLTNGGVVITPSDRNDADGDRLTRLAAKSELYGGTLTGDCFLGGDHGKPTYEIALDIQGVNATALRNDFPILPIASGTLANRLQVKSRSIDILEFLANMRGRVEGRGVNCVLAESGKDTGVALSSLALDLDLRKAGWDNGKLGLSGQWNVRGAGAWNPRVTLQGMVWFGGDGNDAGVGYKDLPVTLEVRNLEGLVPGIQGRDVTLLVKGHSSLQAATPLISFEKARVSVPGFSTSTSLTLRRKNGGWTAEGTATDAHIALAKCLPAFLGKMPNIPQRLHDYTASTHFSVTERGAELTSLATAVDGHKVTGAIATTYATMPHLTFDLKVEDLDLDPYLGTGTYAVKPAPKKPANKEPAKGAGARGVPLKAEPVPKARGAVDTPGRPVDLSFLTTFSGKGTLRAERVHVDGLDFTKVVLPMELKDGQMTYNGLTASFYEGALHGSGTLGFHKGIDYDCETVVRDLDFGALMRAKEARPTFIGRASFSTYLKGHFAYTNRLFQSLGGHLGFSTGPLHYQGVDERGRQSGKPVLFTSTRGSGVLKEGVITTRDFALRSKKLDANGKGTVDLNESTLDLKLDVDMRGLPIVPVRVHGSFADPKTSVSILGTIANIFRPSK